MREIKFRAYDRLPMKKLEKSFTYFTLEDLNCGKIKFPDIQNWEISMFTGLLDKNLKEIYEGDIIKNGSIILPVEWNTIDVASGNCHEEDWFSVQTYCYGNNAISIYCEIIGNIYQDRYLLENK